MTNSTVRIVVFAVVFFAAPIVAAAETSAWLVKAAGLVDLTGPAGPIYVNPPVFIPEGTTVKTGGNGTALIMTDGGSKVQVQADSTFLFAKATETETSFSLINGRIGCWVRQQVGRSFNVRAPGAVAEVHGTIFEIATDGKNSHFDLFKGEVLVIDAYGRRTTESPGQSVAVNVEGGLGATRKIESRILARPGPRRKSSSWRRLRGGAPVPVYFRRPVSPNSSATS